MTVEDIKALEPETFSSESVVMINVPKITDPKMMMAQNRLLFTIHEKGTDEKAFQMIYNSMFGVRFINHRADPQGAARERYLDIDIDLSKATDALFVIMHDSRIYVSVGGLSFVDIIYSGTFIEDEEKTQSKATGMRNYYLVFDKEYAKPTNLKEDYSYEVVTTQTSPAGRHNEIIPDNLQSQLLLVDMSDDDDEDVEDGTGVMQGKKLFYEEKYQNGAWCDAKNRPRETTVSYYCDQYHFEQS